MTNLKLNEIEITASRKIFEACDLNGDGYIDPEEFHTLLNVLDGDVSRAESQLDFESMLQTLAASVTW